MAGRINLVKLPAAAITVISTLTRPIMIGKKTGKRAIVYYCTFTVGNAYDMT